MKHHEVMKLIPEIEQALEANREVAYFDASNQKIFTVKAIFALFIDADPVDNSGVFSVTLTSPDIRRDRFMFASNL